MRQRGADIGVKGIVEDAVGGQDVAAALTEAQRSGDVLAANGVFNDAFYTDVRPILAEWRESRGLPADPMAAFKASGYQKQINEDRVGGQQAGWGA